MRIWPLRKSGLVYVCVPATSLKIKLSSFVRVALKYFKSKVCFLKEITFVVAISFGFCLGGGKKKKTSQKRVCVLPVANPETMTKVLFTLTLKKS